MSIQQTDDVIIHPSRSRPGGRYATIDGALVTDRVLTELYLVSLGQTASNWRTLLFSGEAGTGKRTMAYTAHRWSGSPGGVRHVDCAERSDQLEAILFGDPAKGTRGAQAEAFGGSLILSNIGHLPLALQERVASERTRLLLTSRLPLAALRHAGKLHPALRKNLLMELSLPPLRRREYAVLELFHHFVQTMGPSGRPGWRPPAPDQAALELLAVRSWPGNVTELRAVVIDLLMNGREGSIGPADLQVFEPRFFAKRRAFVAASRSLRA